MLKGHEGPITKIRYNKEGDMLFSCAKKDKVPCAWFSDNGERLGTYEGHTGAVLDIDVSWDTKLLITGSGDMTARLWEVQTGKALHTWHHSSPVRCCAFSEGAQKALTVQDDGKGVNCTVFLWDVTSPSEIPIGQLDRDKKGDTLGRIYAAEFSALDEFIFTVHSDGFVRKWDAKTMKEVAHIQPHQKEIRSIQFSPDKTMFVTASLDKCAKLFLTSTMECLKTYRSDRPLNAASISPSLNHVIVGGGQDAMAVTTTAAKSGHFQVDFFHTVYMEYMGNVKGHFGPVNTLSFCPDGRSYASGSEDGYVRLQHFGKDYFNPKDPYW